MKIKIKLVKQKNKSYCGPASVKMVLDFYGIIKTQNEIGRLLGVTKEYGCDIPKYISRFNKWGVYTRYINNSSLGQVNLLIQKGILPIFYWNKNGEGHYSVFVGIGEKRVFIADPENAKRIVSFTKPRFLKRWMDPGNPKDKREIIVITRRG